MWAERRGGRQAWFQEEFDLDNSSPPRDLIRFRRRGWGGQCCCFVSRVSQSLHPRPLPLQTPLLHSVQLEVGGGAGLPCSPRWSPNRVLWVFSGPRGSLRPITSSCCLHPVPLLLSCAFDCSFLVWGPAPAAPLHLGIWGGSI